MPERHQGNVKAVLVLGIDIKWGKLKECTVVLMCGFEFVRSLVIEIDWSDYPCPIFLSQMIFSLYPTPGSVMR
jgi:hypothetical protein